MFYYQLEKGSKKFRCPNCDKPRVYKRYVDPSGAYADYQYGRCDREQKCGYHKIPDRPNGTQAFKDPEIKPKPIKYIPRNEVIKSLGEYKNQHQLFDFLCGFFPEEDVLTTFKNYCVGSHRAFPNATVFWYINGTKQITRGKIMAYDKSGHRIKKPYPQISSAHKELGLLDYEQDKCLFGEHLLKRHPNKTVCIVESEKSAIIAALYSPEYLWLACGSASQLNSRWLKGLKGRKVILYPDRGQEQHWADKAAVLQSQIKCDIALSYLLRNHTIALAGDGDDIADLILEEIQPTRKKVKLKAIKANSTAPSAKPVIEKKSEALKILIKKNPNIIKLMNRLGLEESSKNVFK